MNPTHNPQPRPVSRLRRFMGGDPVDVGMRLAFASLVVGAVMVWLGLTPERVLRGLLAVAESLADLGLGSLREVAGWLLDGAVIVVPVWLLSRLAASGRRSRAPEPSPDAIRGR